MAMLDEIVSSEPVRAYLRALKGITPLSVRLLERVSLARMFGNDNFVDSTIPGTQKPAVYAVMKLLGDNKGAGILYAASSYGLAMKMIAGAGYRNIRGIDLDEKAVSFCTAHGLRANVMDAAKTSFPDGSFDMAVSRDFVTSGYLPHDKVIAVLNEQHRILKPGGVAVFTTMWPMIPDYHNENLPGQDAINASQFRGSKLTVMHLPLTIPKGTVLGIAGIVANYQIVAYQKSS